MSRLYLNLNAGVFYIAIASVVLSGCTENQYFEDIYESSEDELSSKTQGNPLDPTPPDDPEDGGSTGGTTDGSDDDPEVCDPFDGGGAGEKNGLLGDLYYLNAGGTGPSSCSPSGGANSCFGYKTSASYAQHGNHADVQIFASDISTPTVAWTNGFADADGNYVTNASGEKLVEWFSLHYQTNFILLEGELMGDYQFALISDDGAQISVDDGGGMRMIVDNEGVHPARMGCSGAPVTLIPGVSIDMYTSYFQGPKNHISYSLWYREYPKDGGLVDGPYCGDPINDNGFFWDSTVTPSEPQDAIDEILNAGWKMAVPENFLLDEGTTNPCAEEEK